MAFVKASLEENVIPYVGQVLGALRDPTAVMRGIGLALVSSTQKRIAAGNFTPNSPLTVRMKRGSSPLRDRGQLMASIAFTLSSDRKTVYVGSPLAYAPVHQFGATIQAKNAKKLAIPTYSMAQKRVSPRTYLETLKSQGWRIWVTEGAIMGSPPGSTKAHLLYIRKASVTIPARPFLMLDEHDIEVIKTIVKTEVFFQRKVR